MKASRSRENTPPPMGARRASGNSSPRKRAKLREQFGLLVGRVPWASGCRGGRGGCRVRARCSRPTPRPLSVTVEPACVPGRTSMSRGPSSVSTVATVPSAAAVIGNLERAVQGRCRDARRTRGGVRGSRCRGRRAGPPPGPASPMPDMRMRVPVSTPAGMSTSIERRSRVRPWPEHSVHGLSMIEPIAAALRAGRGGHHLAEQRARDALHHAGAVALRTRGWARSPGRSTSPRHARTYLGEVHHHFAVDAKHGLLDESRRPRPACRRRAACARRVRGATGRPSTRQRRSRRCPRSRSPRRRPPTPLRRAGPPHGHIGRACRRCRAPRRRRRPP